VVVQTVAFQNNTLCWRYKQLLFKSTPTLVVQIKLVPKSLKAQDAAVAKLLMSWSSMASPVLKMQAASQGTQPSTPSSSGH